MASTVIDWGFSFSQGGRVSIHATLDNVPDSEGQPGDVFNGVSKRFQTHPSDHEDAAAMGLALEPKVEKLAPGVLSASQKKTMCRAIAEIMWQYNEEPVGDPGMS